MVFFFVFVVLVGFVGVVVRFCVVVMSLLKSGWRVGVFLLIVLFCCVIVCVLFWVIGLVSVVCVLVVI